MLRCCDALALCLKNKKLEAFDYYGAVGLIFVPLAISFSIVYCWKGGRPEPVCE